MLITLIIVPAMTVLALLFTPGSNTGLLRGIAFVGALATLCVAVTAALNFVPGGPFMQYEVQVPWIKELGASFHVGIDGLSMLLIVLTAVVFPIALLASSTIQKNVKLYTVLMMLLEGSVLGVFLSLDLVLFYFFWEAMLIPTYFLIGVWGGQRRIYAALKYVLYTMTGSLLMLVGILATYFYFHSQAGAPQSFDLIALSHYHLPSDIQMPIFITFALAFTIKSALFPFHTWLPDVYTESDTSVTVVLSSVLSKMGVYGFLRFCLVLFPDASRQAAELIAVLAVISILYGAMLALAQHNIKRLVACSSISHMGFIMLGIFVLNPQGIQGAAIQMLNHGVVIAALFLIVALIAKRWGTLQLAEMGGFARSTPILAAVFLIVTLSSLGLPGLNSFVGEFLILLGAFRYSAFFAITGTIGVILAAAYMLRFFQGVMHGPLAGSPAGSPAGALARVKDMTFVEWTQLLPLLVLIVWIGVAPTAWVDPTATMAQTVLSQIAPGLK